MMSFQTFWERIAYIAQLIPACLLFFHPARKRKYFLFRVSLGSVILVTVSFWLGNTLTVPEELLK